MGFLKFQRPWGSLWGFRVGPNTAANMTTARGDGQVDMTFTAATNGVKYGRLVVIKTNGTVIPTTGSSGRMAVGVTMASASSGTTVRVRVRGVAKVVASTAALAVGKWIRGSSGASTGVLAGTAKATSNTVASVFGITLSSAAASTAASTSRTVRVLIMPAGQVNA